MDRHPALLLTTFWLAYLHTIAYKPGAPAWHIVTGLATTFLHHLRPTNRYITATNRLAMFVGAVVNASHGVIAPSVLAAVAYAVAQDTPYWFLMAQIVATLGNIKVLRMTPDNTDPYALSG